MKKNKVKERFYSVHVIEKTLKSHINEWAATTLTIMGSILNANLLDITSFNTYFLSFYLFFMGNILWIIFAYKHRHWGVFTTFSILGVVNLLAIMKNLGFLG